MRIVSLLPSATEILFAIGAGNEVVGRTHECDFPPEATNLPVLTSSTLEHDGTSRDIDRHVRKKLHSGSSLYALDSDLLEKLAPDLIVTQELCKVCAVSYELVTDAVRKLQGDPRVVSLEPSSLEDAYATIKFLGEATHHQAGATKLIASLRERAQHLEREVRAALEDSGEKPPRVLVLEWTDPPMSGGHWTPGLVELAGGIPLLSNPGANSHVIEWEAIARADPDVIIVGPCGFDLEKTRETVRELESNGRWRGLRAYRGHEIYLLDGSAYLNRPGPRLIDTAEIIATILYEDALDLPLIDPHAWETLHLFSGTK